jgi:hypothetical protein
MCALRLSTWLIAMLAWASGCESTRPFDGAATLLGGDTILGDVVSVDGQTWFLISHEHRRPTDFVTLCRLVSRTATCVPVPGSTGGAHLLEPGPRATPLVALPVDGGTLYVEPFTWKTIRYLADVSFDQHGVVLGDGTLWIERNRVGREKDLLVVPRTGAPRRLLVGRFSEVSLSPSAVVWSEWRGQDPGRQTAYLMSAQITGGQLGPVREHSNVNPRLGLRGYLSCHAGSTLGFIDIDRYLVMLDLDTGAVARIHVGEGKYVHCRPGSVSATPFVVTSSESDPVAFWCNRSGCGSASTRLPVPVWQGAFDIVDGGAFAVVDTDGHGLVTWKLHASPRFLRISGHRGLDRPRTAPLPDGVLVLFASGELLVFDQDGRSQPIELTWLGLAPAPPW